jgi:hypothetical protein
MEQSETPVLGDIVYPVKRENPESSITIFKKRPPLYILLNDCIKTKNLMPNSSKIFFNVAFPACLAFELGCLMLCFLDMLLNS